MIEENLPRFGVALLACILVSINVYGLVICKRFINRLKTKHRDAWVEMGSPELINVENAFQANRLFLFIVFGKHLGRGDRELSWDGVVMQGIIVASLLGLIALFVLLRQSPG